MPTYYNAEGFEGGSFDEFLARLLRGASAGGRSIDLGRLLSARTHELLLHSAQYALEHGQREVDALHLLHTMAVEEPGTELLRRIGVDPEVIARNVEERLPGQAETADVAPSLTQAAQRALFHAYQVARSSGSTYVSPEHLFFALVLSQDTEAGRVLAERGVTPEAVQAALREPVPAGGRPATSARPKSETPMLDQFGVDLTAKAHDGGLDPVIGRETEIELTVEVLSRRTKNNPVLIGEAGVGKTAIVEGLAQRIVSGEVPAQLHDKRVIALDLTAMLAGTRYRGDFEERLGNTMNEISAHTDELIIFIDELHTVVGAGGSGEGGTDAGNILKPRLARGELHLVGATTLKEFRSIEKDPALARRFQPVQVGEPSIEDSVQILMGLRGLYEKHHGVTYTDDAIRAAVTLSARYITDRFLPDKAIDLIDQAGARLRLKLGSSLDTSPLFAQLADLESRKNAAVSAEHYEEASDLRDQIAAVQGEIDQANSHGMAAAEGAVVDEKEIAEVISRATGIPAQRLTETDRQRLAKLEDELHRRVVGQEEAVSAVARAVRRNRAGMGNPHRPVGSFLFLGPTGVGKTELAKALAEALFGDEQAMVRFDMSEFGERHTVSRLVGAPPGYVGYDEAGQLTERVRRRPYTVVLFDEIEKAHPDVFNLLLQVLDDGRLTDGQGRTVDFRNAVIIMTSNIGSEFLASRSGALGFVVSRDAGGFGSEKELRDRVMGRLREAVRPEFLNRIDEIVLFRALEEQQLEEIVRLMLRTTAARLAEQDITLEVSEDAVAWIAKRGYQREYGARPLRRLIQREVEDRVAALLVDDALHAGQTVKVTVQEDALHVEAAQVVA
jgi:ATP-dependent Clp protease ATP-binding subunit ClpC